MTEGLTLTAVGLTAVFVVLAAIAGVVSLLARLDAGWQAREEAAATAATEKPPTVDDTTLVIITAAVATMMVGRHRIHSIRRLPSPHVSGVWSQTGRATLHASHSPHTPHRQEEP